MLKFYQFLTRALVTAVRTGTRLDRSDTGTGSLSEHTKAAAKQGVKSAQAEVAEMRVPPVAQYIMDWFIELKSAAPSNGMGPSVITFEAMESWARQIGMNPSPWEIRTLRAMDRACNSEATKASESGD